VHPDGGNIILPTEGLSVAPEWRLLPEHRLPKRLRLKGFAKARGKDNEYCWRMGEGLFAKSEVVVGLELLPDAADEFGTVRHGVIVPIKKMDIDQFQALLAATRDQWGIDED